MDINKVILIGRLTKDADLRYSKGKGTAITTFTMAVNRIPKDNEKKADFLNITMWGKLGESIVGFLVKGKLVCIVGRIQNNVYEKDGVKHYSYEIIANELQLLSKNENRTNTSNDNDFTPVDGDEDGEIPF
jgi:single-strand DNA-binding protein